MMAWRLFLTRAAAGGAIIGVFVTAAVFVGVKLAGADPGGPPIRNALTFAGVLRNADGGVTTTATALTFIFHRIGIPDCTPPAVMVTPSTSGSPFNVSSKGTSWTSPPRSHRASSWSRREARS